MVTKEHLIEIFENAIEYGYKYVMVSVQNDVHAEPEVIINRAPNFKAKLDYYKQAYNDDLALKANSTIRIIGVGISNDTDDLDEYFRSEPLPWEAPAEKGVRVGPDSVTIFDDEGEVVHWIEDEWKEDPSVGEAISIAVAMCIEKGPEAVRAFLANK